MFLEIGNRWYDGRHQSRGPEPWLGRSSLQSGPMTPYAPSMPPLQAGVTRSAKEAVECRARLKEAKDKGKADDMCNKEKLQEVKDKTKADAGSELS